jgi:phage gp36-like protein
MSYIKNWVEAVTKLPMLGDFTDTTLQAYALKESAGLIDSFLSTRLIVPIKMYYDGVASDYPTILKTLQLQFMQYILQYSNTGHTEELQILFDATAELCKKLQENDLGLPGSLYGENQVGWQIAEISTASGLGSFYLWPGLPAPQIDVNYKLQITSPSGLYIGGNAVTFDIYRSDNSTAQATNQTAKYFWQTYSDAYSQLQFRWDGQWSTGDYVRLVGVPANAVNSQPGDPLNLLRQRKLSL